MPKKNPKIVSKPLAGKTLLIIGAGKSGKAAGTLALKAGADIVIYDDNIGAIKDFKEGLEEKYTSRVSFCIADAKDINSTKISFAVLSPGLLPSATIISEVERHHIPIVSELSFGASYLPCKSVAITGTNGKTTTTLLTGNMFVNAGFVTHVCGNIGYPVSLSAVSAQEEDIAIIEVSSFQLERIDDYHPTIAAVLNISADHLDRHGSMDNYVALKKRIFENMDSSDALILNKNDEYCRSFSKNAKPNIYWFSSSGEVERGAYLFEDKLFISDKGNKQLICPVEEIQLLGSHNIENALVASLVAYLRDIPIPVIRYTLRNFVGAEHRMELVKEVIGVTFINDSKATNPDSTIKAVNAMRSPTILIAGGYDKQTPFEEMASSIAASYVYKVILTGDTSEKIAEALIGAGFNNYSIASSLENAVKEAMASATKGDVVLFSPACSSFDSFKSYEHRGEVFKNIVNNIDVGR
jgi:UDP-N-acetylmuramoylalanine--D-glutamate ligase